MPSTLVHACAANAFCFVTCIIWSMIIQWSVAFKPICLPFFLSQLPWGILAWQIVRTEFEKRPSLAKSFAFQMDLRNPSFCYGLLRVSMGFLRFGYGLEKPGFFQKTRFLRLSTGFLRLTTVILRVVTPWPFLAWFFIKMIKNAYKLVQGEVSVPITVPKNSQHGCDNP